MYSESQGGNIGRIDVRTLESQSIRPVPRPTGDEDPDAEPREYRFNWNSPIVISSHDPATIYIGGNHLMRSSDRGSTWEEASPDLTKTIDRGTKSIDIMLYFLLFNIAPTALELTAVGVIFYLNFGWELVAATALAVGAYIFVTRTITEWRNELRRRMNELDGTALARSVDSLLNYETVKYFGAEHREHAARGHAAGRLAQHLMGGVVEFQTMVQQHHVDAVLGDRQRLRAGFQGHPAGGLAPAFHRHRCHRTAPRQTNVAQHVLATAAADFHRALAHQPGGPFGDDGAFRLQHRLAGLGVLPLIEPFQHVRRLAAER